MGIAMRQAEAEDLRWVWPAACAAHLFDAPEQLDGAWRAAPWTVRVTDSGEAAIVERWRSSLDILAIRGLWCSLARLPVILEDLRLVAAAQGFGRLLGPLVSEDEARAYLDCGMQRAQRIVVLRLEGRARVAPPQAPIPRSVVLRQATAADAAGVLAVDRAAFDEFWAYDAPMLSAFLEMDRVAVAARNAQVIGYTLATMRGSDGSIGRLAVVPEERRRGVGAALLADAIAWTLRQGATQVTICTQEENTESRRLYRAAGFRELPGRLVGTISAPLGRVDAEGGGSS